MRAGSRDAKRIAGVVCVASLAGIGLMFAQCRDTPGARRLPESVHDQGPEERALVGPLDRAGRQPTSDEEPRHRAPSGPEPQRLVLAGRVLTESSSPLVDARVGLYRGTEVLAEAFSMPSGRYEIVLGEPPLGSVDLRCEAPGHRPAFLERVVVPGRYDVTLRSATREVCGVVLGDRFDDPAVGAIVLLTDESGETVGREVADEHGRFCFGRLGAGIYRCAAAAPGYRTAYAGFALIEERELPELTLRLGWTERSIHLQVVEAGAGLPIEGVRVAGLIGEAYRTDSSGTCALPQSDEARVLFLAVEGFCDETFQLLPGDLAPRIELRRECSFGLILIAPSDLFPVAVLLTQPAANQLMERKASCRIEPLSGGRLLAVAHGFDREQPTQATVQGPRIRLAHCQAIPWSDEGRLEDLPVCTLEPGHDVRGSVQDALTGAPLSSARVALFEQGQFESRSRMMSPSRLVLGTSPHQATSDDEGRFILRGLPGGSLDLAVIAPGYAASTLPIEVPTPSEAVVLLARRAGSAGDLGGLALAADGEPWPDSIVRAVDEDGFRTTTLSDDQGRFRFPSLPAGTYRLGISILRGVEHRGWTSKEPVRPGALDVELRTPWGSR